MRMMKRPQWMINVNAIARRIDVDNRISLRYYYRIADNLLRQACIYREENNIVDLYIILLRFSSLVSETIPLHRDYRDLLHKEKLKYKKKLVDVMSELEVLQPEFRRQVDELNRYSAENQMNDTLEQDANSSHFLSRVVKQESGFMPPSSKDGRCSAIMLSSGTMDINKQFQKLSFSLPVPKEETLSRHSFLGPNGLRGGWQMPVSEIKVQYPSNNDLVLAEDYSMKQDGAFCITGEKYGDAKNTSVMESVLSLDDRWRRTENSNHLDISPVEEPISIIKQPLPPPVLAQLQPEVHPIPPSKVADPRPGAAKSLPDANSESRSYQCLHVPVKMMNDFLRLAQENTTKNLETCGVLAGSLKKSVFHITALIIPKQESTPDTCQTLNEEEIFDIQDKFSLFPLGWIHTHPSQSCFMSSVDLHTHYSYQIMLPEAVAIVMAPTDIGSPHGIFHLSDPGGISVIRNCQQRGFHPHEEPEDGKSIYEHCSHVYMNPNLKCDVIDLR